MILMSESRTTKSKRGSIRHTHIYIIINYNYNYIYTLIHRHTARMITYVKSGREANRIWSASFARLMSVSASLAPMPAVIQGICFCFRPAVADASWAFSACCNFAGQESGWDAHEPLSHIAHNTIQYPSDPISSEMQSAGDAWWPV